VQACREARTQRLLAAALGAMQQSAEFSRAAKEAAECLAQQRQRRITAELLELGEP
jgi:hypothetical protein